MKFFRKITPGEENGNTNCKSWMNQGKLATPFWKMFFLYV